MPRIASFISSLWLLAAVPGCHDPLTEVVVVLQSDVIVPTEADGIVVSIAQGPFMPVARNGDAFSTEAGVTGLPLSLGVTSGGSTANFSVTMQLISGFFSGQQQQLIVVSRSVTDIRFVSQETMMLVVPMSRACACQGTSCPDPGNPLCDNIDKPTLQPFDPAVAPPNTMMGSNGVVLGSQPPLRSGSLQ